MLPLMFLKRVGGSLYTLFLLFCGRYP